MTLCRVSGPSSSARPRRLLGQSGRSQRLAVIETSDSFPGDPALAVGGDQDAFACSHDARACAQARMYQAGAVVFARSADADAKHVRHMLLERDAPALV